MRSAGPRARAFSRPPSGAGKPLSKSFFASLFLTLLLVPYCQGQTIILHLRNGDRLAGTIVSEDTNRVILTTTWIKELAVPLSEIASREKPPPTAITNAP